MTGDECRTSALLSEFAAEPSGKNQLAGKFGQTSLPVAEIPTSSSRWSHDSVLGQLAPFRHAPVTLKVGIVSVACREMSKWHAKLQPPVHSASCRIGPCINGFDLYYRSPSAEGQSRSCLRPGARGKALLGL
jgi:hypothetical protein